MEDKLYRVMFVGPTPMVIAEEGTHRYQIFGYFDWGYGGGGPERLAKALVADALGRVDARAALAIKEAIIARLPRNEPWTLFRRHLLADIETFGAQVPDEVVRAVEFEWGPMQEEFDEDEDQGEDAP